MITLPRFFAIVAGISATLFLFGFMAVKGGGVAVANIIITGAIFYGIAFYGFVHYRAVRQEELRDVLAVAAETKSPLAIAVWAYVEDRPRGPLRRFCEGAFTNFLVLGFYWSWHKQRRFDRRVADLASHLEVGVPLSEALSMTPGTASGETILAAAVGESTGDLAGPLRQISSTRIGSAVIEVVPRLVYPVFLLVCQVGVVSFLMIFVAPKFEKIMADFHIRIPEFAATLLGAGHWMTRFLGPFMALSLFGMLWLVPMVIVSPTIRWWVPGLGSIERRYIQGRLLKMLGMLLGAGKTAPQALALLRRDNYLGMPALRRLELVSASVDQGQSLADELAIQRLMPKSMVPLVHAAERARNLPWALEEAGDSLLRSATRLVQRLSAGLGPLAVALMGVFVALIALGVFIPLVTILTELIPR